MPVPGSKGIQTQVTALGERAEAFHNGPLLWMCGVISLFVLILLAWTMFRYRRGANPTPSRTTHNTAIEVLWTLVPVMILVGIAVPSIQLLRAQYNFPAADVTIKVIGNQWYWTYQYPDNGGIEIVSNMLKEQKDVKPGDRYRTDADGPPLLAADERMVIPAGKVVKFIVTSNDVIHAFAVPAFWTKIDANPGRFSGRDKANAGKIMGIIGTVLLIIGIIGIIAIIALIVAIPDSSSSPHPVPGQGF